MSKSETKDVTRSEQKVKKIRLYKFITITLLVVFLLLGLVIFENDITVENLRYLIKYLDFSTSGAYNEETVIHYNADPSNRFYVFRGDLARVTESGITLYDRRGSAVMTDSFSMTSPVCVSSDRYLAVYDLGGFQVRIYNSFSLLYEKSFNYSVQSVSLNSDGDFCVVTSEKSYHSAVFVYDRDFNETYRWLSTDKFATDADLNDSDILTVSAVRVSEGNLVSDVIELKLGEKEPVSTCSFTDEMPLALYTDRKGCLALTDRNLKCIEDGAVIHSAMFQEGDLDSFRFGEKVSVAIQNELSVGVNFLVRVFDREARELRSEKFSVQIRDVEIWGDTVYVLTHTGLFEIRQGEKMIEYPLQGDYSDLGILAKNTVILCSDTSAKIQIMK